MKTTCKPKNLIITLSIAMGFPLVAPATNPALHAPDGLLERALEQARKEDEQERLFKQGYYYTRTRLTEFRNSKGEVVKRVEKSGPHDPLKSAAKSAATATPKPSPLEKGGSTGQPVSDTHSNVRGKAFEKQDFPLTMDLLSRFDFTFVGRENINGRPAFVVDFKPANRKLPERGLKDKFINKAAGRVWLDEEDAAIVKADLYLTKKVNVIGGLVGAVWKFTCSMIRERTPEGFWYIRKSNWHLEGREVFVHRTVDSHEERTDLRKVQQVSAAR